MANISLNIDSSMLELFVVELESHTRTLERGLLGLETNSTVQIFESLMRAAHSIKGAARIIGLHKAVNLAHEMENVFENSRKTGIKIDEHKIQILLDCNDFYSSLLDCETNDIPETLDNSNERIERLINELKKSDTPKTEQNGSGKGKAVSNNNVELQTKQEEKPKVPKRTVENINIDAALMGLFKSEIYSNVKILSDKLCDSNGDFNTSAIDDLQRAVHSIKGASRIVGIEESVAISARLESIFDDVKSGNKVDFSIEGIKMAIDTLKNTPDVENKELVGYFRSLKLESILKDIDNITSKLVPTINAEDTSSSKPKVEANIAPTNESSSEIAKLDETNQSKSESSDRQPVSGKRDERFVRVSSVNLNRLLGFTGEILVQTKSLKPFSKDMQRIKVGLLELNSFKEQIYQDLFKQGLPDDINIKFYESSKQLDLILSNIIRHIENFENFSRRLELTSDRLYNEAVETRMKPFSEGVIGFPRLVRDVSKQLGKKVEIEIRGESTKVDRDILEKLEAPLNHIIRNAIDHGLESHEERINSGKPELGRIVLEARHSSGMLLITISDDGRGINLDNLRKSIVERGFSTKEMASSLSSAEIYDFLFLPGFSTRSEVTEISGRGVGLDVVFSMVNEVGGIIKVESQFGKGTTFQLQLPLTLSVIRTMLVEVGDEPYAIPLSRIDRVLSLNSNDIKSVENLQYLEFNGENIGIVNARQIFGLYKSNMPQDKFNVVILSDRLNRYGLAVDRLVAQPDLVVMQLDKKMGRIPNISSGAILENGTPVLIIDVDDVVRSIDRITKSGEVERVTTSKSKTRAKALEILVVDDSLTVREVEKKLLENKGYKVTVAVDGIDGWNTLHRQKFDLIISDIDMPRMNGIEMVKRIKSDVKFREIPVMIVSYKDREDDRKKGLEAGANYYLTKSSFHDDTLLDAVYDLIGKP